MPINSAQSIRWYYLSQYLVRGGHDVTVIAPDIADDSGLRELSMGNVRVKRYFPGFFCALTNWAAGRLALSKNRNNEQQKSDVNEKQSIVTRIYVSFRRLLDNLLFPDSRAESIPFLLYRARKELASNEYDLVISSHEPATTLIVGNILRNHSPWIADMGDPILSPYLKPQFRYFARQLERAVLKNATCVLVTNNNVAERFKSMHVNYCHTKLEVLPQAAPYNDKDPSSKGCRSDILPCNGHINILFTGNFYSGFRDPKILMGAINELEGVNWVFIGNNSDFNSLKKYSNVYMHNSISHHEIKSLLHQADLLLNIGNMQDYQMPGKIFEYMITDKPVYHIAQGEQDPTVEYFKKENGFFYSRSDSKDVVDSLTSLINKIKIGKLTKIKRDVSEYSWEARAQKLNTIIGNIQSANSKT